MEHVAGMLDSVLGGLFRGGEAIVPGAAEIFVAAGTVLETVRLTRHDGLLLGHAADKARQACSVAPAWL